MNEELEEEERLQQQEQPHNGSSSNRNNNNSSSSTIYFHSQGITSRGKLIVTMPKRPLVITAPLENKGSEGTKKDSFREEELSGYSFLERGQVVRRKKIV